MATPLTSPLSPAMSPAATATLGGNPDAAKAYRAAKAKAAGQDFEAVFLNSMFQQMFAGVGTGLRARWGAIVGYVTAVAMAILTVRVVFADTGQVWQRVVGIGLALASTGAAIAAPVLAWRDSRPGRGDPRTLLVA